MPTYAAIDVGSNAIRGIIADTKKDGSFSVSKKIRESVRFGDDVFQTGALGPGKFKQAEEIFSKIVATCKKENVDKIKVMATSALRDAKNAKEFVQFINQKTGLLIETIDGDTEAKLIHDAVNLEIDLKDKLCVLVDIGGGSTEVTISKNKKLLGCKSFNMGAVRLLECKDLFSLSENVCLQVIDIKNYLDDFIKNQKVDKLIGTGGNFRRMAKIKKILNNKGKDSSEFLELDDIHKIFDQLYTMSHKDRVKRFEMSDDRADVILPATFFIGHIVRFLKMDGVYIPDVGLKEGIMLSMLR